MSAMRMALALLILAGTTATVAAPIDPAIDDGPGPFCYFSRPSTVLGVADALQGTQVTAEGWLWTGWVQLIFLAGDDLAPLRQRIQVLREGALPIVEATSRRGDVEYQTTMFAATLDGRPSGNVVNFVRVCLRNMGQHPVTATFATAVRAEGPGCCERMRKPVEALSARYSLATDCAVRDGTLLYTFPAEPSPRRFVVPDREGTGPVEGRAEGILGAAPACLVRYDVSLEPGAWRILDFKLPCDPVPLSDQKAVEALRAAGFDEYLSDTARAWRRFLLAGMQIELPEAKAVDVYRASLVYDAIARRQEGDDFVPTVNRFQYHHFWVRDGAYIVNAFDLAGRHRWAEEGLQHFLKCRQANGIICQPPQWDGYGQTLWAFGSHWRLTGDDAWARRMYPYLAHHVRGVFAEVAKDPLGLVPAAPPYDNEGIDGHYTGHSFWLLAGMRDMIAMADALGETADATQFRKWHDEYRARFLKQLAAATARNDGYIPPGLDAENGCDWDNLISLYPRGGVPARGTLDVTDPAPGRTADVVREHKYAEGLLTYGHGLRVGSLHHYDTIKCTEGLVALGRQQDVLADFYAILVHTSSANAGFELGIAPWGNRDPGGNLPPHGWFAAEYIGLLRNMLVREEDGDLHLLGVVSPAWLQPGSRLAVRHAPTDFGEVSVLAQMASQRLEVQIRHEWRTAPRRLILHLPWFLRCASAEADGSQVAVERPIVGEGSQLVLSPRTRRVTVRLRPSEIPAINYTSAVAAWKQEYRRRFDDFVSAGGKPEPLWRESRLPMTGAERRENLDALVSRNGIAVGCPATASSSEAGHPPTAACDGRVDVNAYWGATPFPAWWQVDLGQPRLIDRVRVITFWDRGQERRSYQYRVQGSVDGSRWEPLADLSGNERPATAAGELLSFAPRKVRWVRVEMLRNSANTGVHLVEVMVFPAVEAPLAEAPAQCRPAWTAEGQTGAQATDVPNWGFVGTERIVLQGSAVQADADRVRLVFRGGKEGDITIGEVSIGATDPEDAASLQTGTRTPVTFEGASTADLPASKEVATDWVMFPLRAGRSYTVSFVVLRQGATTLWPDAKTARFEASAEAAQLPRWASVPYQRTHNLYFLARLEVPR
jgi:hypothetical protein